MLLVTNACHPHAEWTECKVWVAIRSPGCKPRSIDKFTSLLAQHSAPVCCSAGILVIILLSLHGRIIVWVKFVVLEIVSVCALHEVALFYRLCSAFIRPIRPDVYIRRARFVVHERTN